MPYWVKRGSEILFEHPRIGLVEDSVRLPGGENSEYLRYEGKHYQDFPTIIAINDKGDVLLIEDYACPSNRVLIQFPEGATNGDEKVEDAAKRELLEEAGCTADKMEVIGSCLHEHRRSDCKQITILATKITETEKAAGDIEEGDIKKYWMSEAKVWKLIADGKIIQRHTLAAWAHYQAYLRHY